MTSSLPIVDYTKLSEWVSDLLTEWLSDWVDWVGEWALAMAWTNEWDIQLRTTCWLHSDVINVQFCNQSDQYLDNIAGVCAFSRGCECVRVCVYVCVCVCMHARVLGSSRNSLCCLCSHLPEY